MLEAGGLYAVGSLLVFNSFFYVRSWPDLKGVQRLVNYFFGGMDCVYFGLFASGHINEVPFLFGINTIFESILFPGYAIGTAMKLNRNFVWRPIYWLVLIFPLSQILLMLYAYPLDREVQLANINNAIEINTVTFYVNPLAFYLHLLLCTSSFTFVIYIILAKFKWQTVALKYRAKVLLTGFILLLVVVVTFLFSLVHVLSTRFQFGHAKHDYFVFYVLIFYFYLFVQLWPYYFKYGAVYFDTKTFRIDKYFNSLLDDSDVQKIKKNLDILISREKVYKDEDLNIVKLAVLVDVSHHKLSEYLNNHLDQNFSDFINFNRIEEAKSLLMNEPEMKILDICYDIGYNSPSAFYKAFKNFTGVIPKEWRMSYRNN